MTPNILDTMLMFHKDPKLLVSEEAILDSELNASILARSIEEDKDAWWIKHNGEYIFYCRKNPVKVKNNIRVGQQGLEIGLQELWGRYTKKPMADFIYVGYNV